MMSRRADRCKSIFRTPSHHLIDGGGCGPDAMANGGKTLRAHHRVRVEIDSSLRGCCSLDGINVRFGMDAQDRCPVDAWRLGAAKGSEPLVLEGLRYGAQTVWPLRMIRSSIVQKARWMAEVHGGHGCETRGA